MPKKTALAAFLGIACLTLFAPSAARAGDYFEIEVLDEATGRGVPLIELTTTSNVRCVTDSAGRAAFDEPDLMDREVFFSVKGHGYEFPADGFGSRGVGLTPTPGGKATIQVKRKNIAERVYRITGQGLYRDTLLLGHQPPLAREGLPGNVTGQDSVQMTKYQDKLYWFYGDTNLAHYPLGIFRTAGATTPLPGKDFGAERGVPLKYFVDDNHRARNMVPLAREAQAKEGVVWIDGLITVPDDDGRERMVCRFERLKGLGNPIEQGLAVWDDDQQVFVRAATLKHGDWRVISGHPLIHREQGIDYIYSGLVSPNVRVQARLKEVLDATKYESLQTDLSRENAALVWKAAPPTGRKDGHLEVRDAASDKRITLQGGSVRWNKHRQRWVMVAVEQGGTSFLGEVWYSEADAPTGPWKKAVKVVTHDKYSFYNPVHHDILDTDGGRVIYFEGTYTHTFSGNDHPTPRYDYNQVMYRLDLDDARLMPVRE